MEKKIDLPIFETRAAFEPATANPEKRTVEVVWSTGARVLRSSWFDGPFWEELSLDPANVRMDRLNSGAPILNTHSRNTLEDVLGVVEKAWIVNPAEARAIIRFSERAEVQPIFQDVVSGIIRNVSVGYKIHKMREVERVNDVPVFRAEDWEPMEISFVPVGADAGSGVRSESGQSQCLFVSTTTRGGNVMDPTIEEAGEPSPAVVVAEDVRAEERKRVSEIMSSCRKAGLDSSFAENLISEGTSLDASRAVIIDAIAERASKVKTESRVSIVADEGEKRVEAVENALLHRANGSQFKLNDGGRQYRSLSLLEIAREFLEAHGTRTRELSRVEIAGRALHTTSDFPLLLANVAGKTLRQAYEAAPQTFRPIVRVVEVPDFKLVSRVQLGDAPSLEKVNESGEFKSGTISEGREQYKIATYGKTLGISRQVIINDDLGAFTRIPELFGRAAADLESDLVWGIVTANAAMADGDALFHANHKNMSGAGAISVTTLGAARVKLRSQTGLNGRLLNLEGRFLVVPAALETIAQQYVRVVNPESSSNVNPFQGLYVPVVEPRLDANSATIWYLFADPSQIDTIELAYLQGQQGVFMETRQGFEVDGMEIKCRLDVGAKAIDWRGMVKAA